MKKEETLKQAYEVYEEISEMIAKIRRCYDLSFIHCKMEIQCNKTATLVIEIPQAKMLGADISIITSGSPRVVRKILISKLKKVLPKT